MRGTPCTYIHTLFTREVPLHDVAPMRDSKAMRRPATGRAVVSHGGMPLLTFCHAAPLQHDVFLAPRMVQLWSRCFAGLSAHDCRCV